MNEVSMKDHRLVVDLNNPVARFPLNPILTAKDVNQVWTDPGLQVTTAHNAGIALNGDETVMLFRAHLRCGISVLGLARSTNGIDGWLVDSNPAMLPATPQDSFAPGVDIHALVENESGGVHEPRIKQIGGTDDIPYT